MSWADLLNSSWRLTILTDTENESTASQVHANHLKFHRRLRTNLGERSWRTQQKIGPIESMLKNGGWQREALRFDAALLWVRGFVRSGVPFVDAGGTTYGLSLWETAFIDFFKGDFRMVAAIFLECVSMCNIRWPGSTETQDPREFRILRLLAERAVSCFLWQGNSFEITKCRNQSINIQYSSITMRGSVFSLPFSLFRWSQSTSFAWGIKYFHIKQRTEIQEHQKDGTSLYGCVLGPAQKIAIRSFVGAYADVVRPW